MILPEARVFELSDSIIEDFIFAMEDQDGSWLVDLETGELIQLEGEEADGAAEQGGEERDLSDGERYAAPPEWSSREGFKLMEGFLGTVRQPSARNDLGAALSRGKGVFKAFKEALAPGFTRYQREVVANACAMAAVIQKRGYRIVSGGTDNHLMLVDLRSKKLTGKAAEAALGRAHITCNKNGIPFDPEKPMTTSGIRLGTPAATSRGFGIAEFKQVGELIAEVLDGLSTHGEEGNAAVEQAVAAKVKALTARFPIY